MIRGLSNIVGLEVIAIPSNAGMQILQSGQERSFGAHLSQWAIRVICYSGLAVANYYSFSMTATGFVETSLLPKNNIIADSLTPYLISGFVQLGILAFYLSLPSFSKRAPFMQIAAFAMALPLLGLTILFSLFAITFTADGDKLERGRSTDLIAVQSAIINTDKGITDQFNRYIGGLEESRKRAIAGKDGTGVAECGDKCRRFDKQYIDMTLRFGPTLQSYGSAPEIDGKDPKRDLQTIESSLKSLATKMNNYTIFIGETGLPNNNLISSLNEIRSKIIRLSKNITDENNDKSGLVLDKVFSEISAIAQGKGEPRFALSLLIAVLPDFLSWLFSVLLIIQERASSAVDLPSEDEIRKKTAIWRRGKILAEESLAAFREYAEVKMREFVERRVHEKVVKKDDEAPLS